MLSTAKISTLQASDPVNMSPHAEDSILKTKKAKDVEMKRLNYPGQPKLISWIPKSRNSSSAAFKERRGKNLGEGSERCNTVGFEIGGRGSWAKELRKSLELQL